MPRLRFHLKLDAQEYLAYYSGQVKSISVLTDDGLRIEFPAEHLRPFVRHMGIEGYFEISYDENFKLKDIKKV